MKLSDIKPYYDAGWSLLYLHPRDKRPLENKWTTGPRKTWDELKREFHPSYNVGVRLGETSKIKGGYLCCIDVDIKDPAYRDVALKKLKEIGDGKHFPVVLSGSGSGSRHLYAVSDEPFKMVEIEKHKDQWEICAYSTGRQMVLPPSLHPRGTHYKWRGSRDVPLPVLDPRNFQNQQRRVSESEANHSFQAVGVDLHATKLSAATISLIVSGEGSTDRSAELLSIAMKMCRAGMSDNEILSVLSDNTYFMGQTAFDHTQSTNRGRAVQWLRRYALDKARHETHPLRLFENATDYTQIKRTPEEITTHLKEIQNENDTSPELPDRDGHGKPKNTLRNLIHVLGCLSGGGPLVGFNEFSCRPYFLRDTVYGGKKGAELSDKDDLALKHYLACHYRFEPSKETCFEAHTLLAHQNRFHPVKKYLEGLEWDGVTRLDNWLMDAFQATGPRPYLQAVGRKALCAAVARIYEPGCKFDYMMVLEGNQGEGKSLALSRLVGASWFTDSLGDIHNKDVVDQMIGKWLIEAGELDSIRGREVEAVKAFISRQVDRVRLSYARRAEDFPRQCIFIGSTNDQEYLTDETGNRRYWPVKVGRARQRWLREHRDQLWAEARFRYELGEKLYLSKELEAVARNEQEKRYEVDDWEARIKKIVEDDPSAVHTTTDLWRALHDGMVSGFPVMAEHKRIGKIMKRLRYDRALRRVEGVPTRVWMGRNV